MTAIDKDDANEIESSLGMFEAALESADRELPIPKIERIAVALDGSNQEKTARSVADVLMRRTGSAAPTMIEPPIATGAADRARTILDAVRESNADILVVPTPFGEDYEAIGSLSLGAVVDILISKTPVPLLVVRGPVADVETTLGRPVCLVDPALADQSADALRHALAVAAPNHEIAVVANVDHEAVREMRTLFEGDAEAEDELTDAHIERAVLRRMGDLIAAAQHRVEKNGHDLSFEIEVRTPTARILERRASDPPRLIVVTARGVSDSLAVQHAREAVRGAIGPVLVVAP